jgi:hypothetical protein
MYRDTNKDSLKSVKDCLLVPVLYESRMIGLISSNNFPNLQHVKENAQYLVIICSFLVSRILQKFSLIKTINYKLKYRFG